MPKYNVHLFVTLHVKQSGVEADNAKGAIEKAIEQSELYRTRPFDLDGLSCEVMTDEDPMYYLVDPLNAAEAIIEDSPESGWYGPEYEPHCTGYDVLFRKVLKDKKALLALVGIDPDLDKFIDTKLRENS